MPTIKVVNIKCGGCEKNIISTLAKSGLTDVKVEVAAGEVSFNGDTELAKRKLSDLGYPEVGSQEANSLLKKAKSYTSCLIGRMKK